MNVNKSGISRADLIRVWKTLGPEGLEASAPALGFYRKGKRKPAPEPVPLPPMRRVKADEPQPEPGVEHRFDDSEPRAVFWRAERFIQMASEPEGSGLPDWWETEPEIGTADEVPGTVQPVPPRIPLLPWSRLWPFLFAALGCRYDSHRVDMERVIHLFCHRKPITRLPYVPRLTWAGRGQLLVDVNETLMPFWDDSGDLLRRIVRLRGISGLEVSVIEQTPDDGCRGWTPRGGMGEVKPYGLPVPGAPVLVMGDLGCLDPEEGRMLSWLRLGKRLKNAGFHPAALMPCPPRLWDPRLSAYWTMVYWDHGVRVPRGPERVGKPVGLRKPSAVDREKGALRLLAMMGAAVRVEPALLRALRRLLPGREADVGSEAMAWQHAALNRSPLACGFQSGEQAQAFRDEFYGLPPALREKVQEVIHRHHVNLPGSVRMEETVLAAGSGWEQYLRRLLKTGKNGMFPVAVGEWLDRFFKRIHEKQFDSSPLLSPLWLMRNREAWERGQVQAPKGWNFQQAAWVLDKGKPVQLELAQRGTVFTSSKEGGGSPLVTLVAGNGRVVVDMENRPEHQGFNLEEGGALSFPVPETQRVGLESKGLRVELVTCEKPQWATAMGRDRHGLFVCFDEGEEERKAYWLQPGRYPVHVGPGERIYYTVSNGLWWDERECLHIQRDGFVKPEWADTLGIDQYGIYADFSIKGVTQRMRLILPGEFLMGSPPEEEDRFDSESLHRVVLTRGLWLADTACTQELWKAVLKKKPSNINGLQRPVEKVSWEDCRAFFEKIKRLKPGLELALPTEAQWEYACRAGTTTPFSFGPNITQAQVNYNGEYPYVGGEKGQSRGETVEVKSLPCHDWGLYQMHGNVWEWCANWYGSYSEDIVLNPTGPGDSEDRVCRGGSWIDGGRYVRSAVRDGYVPSFRGDFLGFRFSQVFSSPTSSGGERASRSPVEQLERSGDRDTGAEDL
jgi:formylglycine-generating enzyme required for sulfatase activity